MSHFLLYKAPQPKVFKNIYDHHNPQTAAEHASTRPAVQPVRRRRSQSGHAQPPEEPNASPPAAQAAQETGLYSARVPRNTSTECSAPVPPPPPMPFIPDTIRKEKKKIGRKNKKEQKKKKM